MTMARLAAATVLLCIGPFVSGICAERLERVVIVERHGIRAPSESPEALAKYAQHPWPSWPVAPGDLTPHGALNLQLLGSWMRANYTRLGVLPASGCPAAGAVFVWADGRDRRTGESGDALLGGLTPGCGLSAHHGEAKAVDPLFDATASGTCKLDPAEATASITEAMAGGLDNPVPHYAEAMSHLAGILGDAHAQPDCGPDRQSCFPNGKNLLVVTTKSAKVSGPLATASMLMEALSLQYDEAMEPQKLGWKPVGLENLEAIAPLHNGYNDLTRKNPSVSRHNGALMAQAIAAALQGQPSLPGQGDKAARMTIFFGHDTTLENVAGFFGLDWKLKDQPDNTPPGGAIVFEVYSDEKGSDDRVKVSLLYQTADQLRQAVAFDQSRHLPGRMDLQPSLCGGIDGSSCSLATIIRSVEDHVPEGCGHHDERGVNRP